MRNIYVCVGSTGEYSAHREWFVMAFTSKADGEDFTERVAEEYRKLKIANDGKCSWEWVGKNTLDPAMQTDYTGTNYSLVSVPLQSTRSKKKGEVTRCCANAVTGY